MKRLLVLVIALAISVSGCYNSKNEIRESNDVLTKKPVNTVIPSSTPSEDDESTIIKLDDSPFTKLYDLPNGKEIYYSQDKVIMLKSGEKKTLINDIYIDDFSSSPVLSPDKKNIAYISPYEFEMNGNVYIFDTNTETSKKVVKVDTYGEDSAKVVKWLDNDRLLVIIGYGKGTLSKGGNLYLHNLKTGELKTIKEVSENQEIVDVNIGKEGPVLDIITWNEDWTDYTSKKFPIKIE